MGKNKFIDPSMLCKECVANSDSIISDISSLCKTCKELIDTYSEFVSDVVEENEVLDFDSIDQVEALVLAYAQKLLNQVGGICLGLRIPGNNVEKKTRVVDDFEGMEYMVTAVVQHRKGTKF